MTYITTSICTGIDLNWIPQKNAFTDSEIDKCTVTKGDLLVCEGET